MKNKYEVAKIIIIVFLCVATGASIGYGICHHVFGMFGGKGSLSGPLSQPTTDTIQVSHEYQGIKVDLDMAQLTIVKGDTPGINYNLPAELVPDVNVEDGILHIENKKNQSFNLKSFIDNYNLEIVVPKDAQLETIEVNVDLGDIRINEIDCRKLTVNADCGNIIVKDINTDIIAVNADLGNVQAEKVSFGETNISVDAGNIQVNGCKAQTIEAGANMGNVEFRDMVFTSGKFNADMGDIVVCGDYDAIDAKCSLGAVNLETVKPESEVNIHASVDLGKVTVNGHDW